MVDQGGFAGGVSVSSVGVVIVVVVLLALRAQTRFDFAVPY